MLEVLHCTVGFQTISPLDLVSAIILLAGTGLFSVLEPLKERVAVIISADLAHTHLASGPYGYSNASQPFDDVRV